MPNRFRFNDFRDINRQRRTPRLQLSDRYWGRGFPPRGSSHRTWRALRDGRRHLGSCAAARGGTPAGGAPGTWIEADVTGPWTAPPVDLWHDRAVFHFLTDALDRSRYHEHLLNILKPGGQAVFATFALDGPSKCSGLPVMRYSAATLSAELGPKFRLVETLDDEHRTPSGDVQRFCYSRFIRD
jgi:hypothetical protein